MAEHTSRTELSEFGEFGLIRHLTQNVKHYNSSTLTGIGDDAAVIDCKDLQQVVTTDLLVEGVHFDLMYCPLKHLGYKAVVVNISDVYAMNADPKQITVSIAVSNRFSTEALEELYEGILLACNTYNVDLVGGDTTSSLSGLVISITAIGEAKKKSIVRRNTANENDLICVSGDLAAAYLGLQILEREKLVYKASPGTQPKLTDYDYILERQLKPEARRDVINALRELDITPTSMIDISDGLASEMIHICSQSNKGCALYEEKIPITYEARNTSDELGLNPITCALNGGEDYELLFTIKLSDHEKIKNSPLISIIGHITDANSGINMVTNAGQLVKLTAQGWNAFGDN